MSRYVASSRAGSVFWMNVVAVFRALKQVVSEPSRQASTVLTKPASLPPTVTVTMSVPAFRPPS